MYFEGYCEYQFVYFAKRISFTEYFEQTYLRKNRNFFFIFIFILGVKAMV